MRAAAKLALVAGCLALGACAAGPRVPRYTERFEREVRTTANPGSVVATDIGFSRAAREDGHRHGHHDEGGGSVRNQHRQDRGGDHEGAVLDGAGAQAVILSQRDTTLDR